MNNWKPKEEYTRVKFDPNLRLRMDELHPDLIWKGIEGRKPEKEP